MNSENQEMLTHEFSRQNEFSQKKELLITSEINVYLTAASKWGKFLAILGFIFTGLIVFGGVIMSFVFAFIPSSEMNVFPFPSFLIGFIYLILGLVYLFPALYLFRFSTGIESAFRLKDQTRLTKAFYYLKAQYKYIGVFMIIMLALYPIIIVVAIFAGLFAGSSGFPGLSA